MKVILLLAAFLLLVSASPQQRRIGEIEFYGYTDLDLSRLRSSLPVHEGDPISEEKILEAADQLREAVKQALGRDPTDVAPVCCDDHGNWMIYIGLPGSSVKSFDYNAAPKRSIRLPGEMVKLYDQSMDDLAVAVRQQQAQEDESRGYVLSAYPPLRAKQLTTRAYAIRHERLVRRALEFSSQPEQRWVAAHILGYARQSKQQRDALVRASRDISDTVRNNAVRALSVLAQSSAKVAARIPAGAFVDMINSGSWTDRNKGGWLLELLSARRDPKLMAQLRARSMESLIEMAQWRSAGHAHSARVLLGRIAGIEENRLQELVTAGRVEQIIESLKRSP